MNKQVRESRKPGVEQLPELHSVTKAVAAYCRKELMSYLATLAPLFQPRRLLGQHIEGSSRQTVLKANEDFGQLRDLYIRVAKAPFELRPELSSPIKSISSQLKLSAWEEEYPAVDEKGRRKLLTVTSPLTWVVSYPSTYSFSMICQVLEGKLERDIEALKSFVLQACVLKVLLDRYPGLSELLEGLRYQVEVRYSKATGDLPLVTISAPLSTLRPEDPVLIMAASVTGRAAFEEILDMDSLETISDPWRERIRKIVAEEKS